VKSRFSGPQSGGGNFPTGGVRSVKGALPIALRAKAEDKIGLLVPKDNAAEAAVVKGLQVIPIQNLRQAVGFLEGEVKIPPTRVDLVRLFDQPHEDELDFAEGSLSSQVRRDLRAVPVLIVV
jgi:magnesium chelatase family protein